MRVITTSVAVVTGMILSMATYSAEKFDFGKREYESNCAVCHGKTGKGDGPYAGILDKRIPELTTLTKKNKGVFPTQRVMELIDGRQTVKVHGPRDMPIWGNRYLAAGAESYMDVPYEPEFFVRTRILALTDYIHRLQEK